MVDLAVAPDSSAVVVLDSAGRLHIGQVTSERGLKPRNKAPFAVHGLKPEQIALIPCDAVKAGSNEKGFFIAVSYEQGRLVHLANLQGQVLSSISISQPASQDGLQSFGHLHYNATHSTLFLSSSLRGSIYAFHIEPWPPAEPSLLGMGERDLDWLLHAATASRSNIPSARINRMVEISCPSHAVEYVDATTADQMVEVDQDMASFHVLAVEGISQTKFDASLFGNMAEAAARSRGDDAPGVMEEQPASLTNFRNAISVDVDLAVETDHESDAGSSKQQQQQQELPEVTVSLPPIQWATELWTDLRRHLRLFLL